VVEGIMWCVFVTGETSSAGYDQKEKPVQEVDIGKFGSGMSKQNWGLRLMIVTMCLFHLAACFLIC
jgi:hypothetical protein